MDLVWDIYHASVCERLIVDRGSTYTERLFGAAMKKTDETFYLVLRFLKTTPFVVLSFLFSWSGMLCCVVVPGTLGFTCFSP